jgi:very-short-patch-repair endonuclease
MAAILAYGTDAAPPLESTVLDRWGAALSHRSAAELWRLLPPADGPVDVSVPSDGGRRKRSGIRLHRCSTLLPASVTSQQGIPVTTPASTIADLRPVTSQRELRRAIRQAEVLGLTTGAEAITARTRSDLELAFRRLCRRHRLPAPEVNVRIGPMEVDFLWRDQRLVVETDGYRYHRGKEAFENDRDRDLRLRALGFEVVRLSEQQVADEPTQAAAVLRKLLSEQRMAGRRH